MYRDYEATDAGYRLFRAVAAVVELSNFALPIVVYFSCSEEFRVEFIRILQVTRQNRRKGPRETERSNLIF